MPSTGARRGGSCLTSGETSSFSRGSASRLRSSREIARVKSPWNSWLVHTKISAGQDRDGNRPRGSLTMSEAPARRPFRIVDSMLLVAATAVAFTISRNGWPPGLAFTTFGGSLERLLFVFMRQCIPFPAMWTLTIVVLAWWDQRRRQRRAPRHAGIIACYAAGAAIVVTSFIGSSFYAVHVLEDNLMIPKILSHATQMHPFPPFANAPLEEIVGASVLGAWTTLAGSRRWRTESSWIDRLGRVLGVFWILLFLCYVYAYTG